jgi:DNA-binding ferritin-like protein (Dps family)
VYNPEQSLKEKEMQFIDDVINDAFKPVDTKVSTWSQVVVFLGIMLYLYSRKGKNINELKDVPNIDFSAKKIEDANVPDDLMADISKIAFPASADTKKAIDLAYQDVGTYIKGIQDDARKEIRTTLIQSYLGKIPAQQVAHELYKKFEKINKNWRLIAITENSRMAIMGFFLNLVEEEMIVGHSLAGACPECLKLINGREFIYRKNAPTNPTIITNENYTWAGKTNYGLDRKNWLPGVIPCHPGCRCYFSIGITKGGK